MIRPPRSRIPGSLYGRSSVFRGGRGAGLMEPRPGGEGIPESPLFPKQPSAPMAKAATTAPAQISPDPSMPTPTAMPKPTWGSQPSAPKPVWGSPPAVATPAMAKPLFQSPTDTTPYNSGSAIPTPPGIGGASPQQRPLADFASVDRRNSGLWPRAER